MQKSSVTLRLQCFLDQMSATAWEHMSITAYEATQKRTSCNPWQVARVAGTISLGPCPYAGPGVRRVVLHGGGGGGGSVSSSNGTAAAAKQSTGRGRSAAVVAQQPTTGQCSVWRSFTGSVTTHRHPTPRCRPRHSNWYVPTSYICTYMCVSIFGAAYM